MIVAKAALSVTWHHTKGNTDEMIIVSKCSLYRRQAAVADLGYWRGARRHRSSVSSGAMSGNATPTGEVGSGSIVRSILKQEEPKHVPMAASLGKGDYNGGWSTF